MLLYSYQSYFLATNVPFLHSALGYIDTGKFYPLVGTGKCYANMFLSQVFHLNPQGEFKRNLAKQGKCCTIYWTFQ